MKLHLFFAIVLFTCGQQQPSAQTKPVSHDIFDGLLKKYVDKNGNVNYIGLKKDQKILDSYLTLLSSNEPSASWSKDEQLAYWINAYNAFTISLVVKHYPVASIKEIRPGISFINSVWDIKFIKIGKETYDLNNLEHGIIRKKYDEPRVHFAINCASYSCPALRNEAYTADKLDAQLTDAAKSFLADKNKNEFKADRITISKIFDWFTGDFKKNGSLIDFLNKYAPVKINAKAKIDYKDYLWSLNKQ
ncbi:MAG: DUF547 domain-containing protein [Saprospiraceae bacterium]|nr:DUF547 domain-containing protein [Saprospiraceae bacterium]